VAHYQYLFLGIFIIAEADAFKLSFFHKRGWERLKDYLDVARGHRKQGSCCFLVALALSNILLPG
jgi:hypothetical protein